MTNNILKHDFVGVFRRHRCPCQVAEDEPLKVDLPKRRMGRGIPVPGQVFRRQEIDDFAFGRKCGARKKASIEHSSAQDHTRHDGCFQEPSSVEFHLALLPFPKTPTLFSCSSFEPSA